MLPTLLSGVPISNSTKGTESEFFLQKWNFGFFLLFFQEACFIKLNRVEPPKNLEKLQKKEKERIEWKMKMKNEKWKKKERKHSKNSNNSWIVLLFFSPKALDTFYQTKQEKYLGSAGFCYLAWLLSPQLTGMLPTLLRGVHISNSTKGTESEFFLQKWNFEGFLLFF